jgi:SPW repeat
MSLDRVQRHRAIDIALLVSVVGLTVATWAAISQTGGLSAWKPCFGISATIFLALAALTPHAPWAATVRLAMSGWIILAPWLLAFADLPLARWSHLITGTLIAALSAPHLLYRPAFPASDDASCA